MTFKAAELKKGVNHCDKIITLRMDHILFWFNSFLLTKVPTLNTKISYLVTIDEHAVHPSSILLLILFLKYLKSFVYNRSVYVMSTTKQTVSRTNMNLLDLIFVLIYLVLRQFRRHYKIKMIGDHLLYCLIIILL